MQASAWGRSLSSRPTQTPQSAPRQHPGGRPRRRRRATPVRQAFGLSHSLARAESTPERGGAERAQLMRLACWPVSIVAAAGGPHCWRVSGAIYRRARWRRRAQSTRLQPPRRSPAPVCSRRCRGGGRLRRSLSLSRARALARALFRGRFTPSTRWASPLAAALLHCQNVPSPPRPPLSTANDGRTRRLYFGGGLPLDQAHARLWPARPCRRGAAWHFCSRCAGAHSAK